MSDTTIDAAIDYGRTAPRTEPQLDDLGLLFVHGIGQQRRGQTLLQAAEGVHDWLTAWLEPRTPPKIGEPAPRKRVEVIESFLLESPPDDPAAPAFTRSSVALDPDSDTRSTWLFAESWWAESFEPPSFSSFARWGVTVLPWNVLVNFVDLLRLNLAGARKPLRTCGMERALERQSAPLPTVGFLSRFAGALGAFLAFGLLLPLSLVFQILILALVVLRLVPRLGTYVTRIQSALAKLVGDVQILLNFDIRFHAMVQQVFDDLDWIAGRAHRVLLVTHSQGAAVMHEVLRMQSRLLESGAPKERLGIMKVRRWISYGEALARYQAMRYAKIYTPSIFGGTVAAVLTASVVAFVFLVDLFGAVESQAPTPHVLMWLVGMLALAILLGLFGMVSPVSMHRINDLRRIDYRISGLRSNVWMDVYASADPAPNGPLFEGKEEGSEPEGNEEESEPKISEVEVTNRRLVLLDHTTYWGNVDEFISTVASVAAQVTTGRTADDPRHLATAVLPQESRARRRRFTWLVAIRIASAAWTTLLVAALLAARSVYGMGTTPSPRVEAPWLLHWIEKLPTSIAEWVVHRLFVDGTSHMLITRYDLAWIGVTFGLVVLPFLAWSILARRSIRRFFVSRAAASWTWQPVFLVFLMCLPIVSTVLFAKNGATSLDAASFEMAWWVPAVIGPPVAAVILITSFLDRGRFGYLSNGMDELRRGQWGASVFGLLGVVAVWPWLILDRSTTLSGSARVTRFFHSGQTVTSRQTGLVMMVLVLLSLFLSLLGRTGAENWVAKWLGTVGLIGAVAATATHIDGVVMRAVMLALGIVSVLFTGSAFDRAERMFRKAEGTTPHPTIIRSKRTTPACPQPNER